MAKSNVVFFRMIDYSVHFRSLQIDWMSPGRPSGIILGYDLLRKTWRPCSKTEKLMKDHTGGLCKAVECQKHERLCGTRCYSPEAKVNLFKRVSKICFSHYILWAEITCFLNHGLSCSVFPLV